MQFDMCEIIILCAYTMYIALAVQYSRATCGPGALLVFIQREPGGYIHTTLHNNALQRSVQCLQYYATAIIKSILLVAS